MTSSIRSGSANVAPKTVSKRLAATPLAATTPASTPPAAREQAASSPDRDRFEGSSASSAQAHLMGRESNVQVGLSTGSTTTAPASPLPALDPSRVPSDEELRQMTPTSRARLLGRLASTKHEAEAMPAGAERDRRLEDTRAATARVVASADGPALMDTLRIAAGNRTLGAITEAVGLEPLLDAGKRAGVNVNDVLATSDTVKERGLTTYERDQVQQNFAGTLDPETVRFKFSTGAQSMGASAMVIGNKIHVDPTDPRWGFEPGTTRPADLRGNNAYNEVLLAHEPAHVWSYQHQGSQYAVNSIGEQTSAIAAGGDRNGAYSYTVGLPSFFSYGEEQRAMIVEDYVASKRAQTGGENQVWLERYVQEMRAAGPGDPNPPGEAHPVACSHCRLSAQDGIADAVASNADALLAGVGQAAMNGLQSGNAAQVVAGAAGVAGVIAGSLLTRDQNGARGGSGGGSALLDQAGIPRGLDVSAHVNGVDVIGAARFGYDAGSRDDGLFAAPANPRVELEVGVSGSGGEVAMHGNAAAEIGLDGSLRQVGASFGVQAPELSVFGQGSLDLRASDRTAQGSFEVQGAGFGVQAAGNVHFNEQGVQGANLAGQVDTPQFSVGANATFTAGWQFEVADLRARARGPGWSVFTDATFRSGGLDALSGGFSAQVGNGTTVSASGGAEGLQSGAPTYQGSVTVTGQAGGLTASGQHNPDKGLTTFRAGFVIPLRP